MGCLVLVFPPSKNFENYLKCFIQQNFDLDGNGGFLDIVIRHSLLTLSRTCKTGPKGRTLSKPEFEQVLQHPFKNSVFGDSLDRIMQREAEKGSTLLVPRILPSLINAIVRLEGHKLEGIFRVPGDAEAVSGIYYLIRFTVSY
jgi:hypothetical protein